MPLWLSRKTITIVAPRIIALANARALQGFNQQATREFTGQESFLFFVS